METTVAITITIASETKMEHKNNQHHNYTHKKNITPPTTKDPDDKVSQQLVGLPGVPLTHPQNNKFSNISMNLAGNGMKWWEDTAHHGDDIQYSYIVRLIFGLLNMTQPYWPGFMISRRNFPSEAWCNLC